MRAKFLLIGSFASGLKTGHGSSALRATFSGDEQRIGNVSLSPVTWAVHNAAIAPKSRGTAAIEIDRFLAAHSNQEISQFIEAHANGQFFLPAVYLDQIEKSLVPPQGRPWMPLLH